LARGPGTSIASLAVLLRVIWATSVMQYKGIKKPLPQIARELNVDAVVEGRCSARV
jgi:TolB-like protein